MELHIHIHGIYHPAEKQSLLFLVVVRTHRVTVKKETIIWSNLKTIFNLFTI